MSDTSCTEERWTDERAVSPVIGVILMVAISVILAAVIGAFVLEIGDQQETAPKTSFQTEERVVTLESNRQKNMACCGSNLSEVNTSQVILTHTGGDTLSIAQTEIRVEGHRDAWGVVPNPNALEMSEGNIDDSVELGPQPDFRRTAGTNDASELASGESWNVVAFDLLRGETNFVPKNGVQKSLYEPGTRDVSPPPARAGEDFIYVDQQTGRNYGCLCTTMYIWADADLQPPATFGDSAAMGEQLKREEEVRAIWSAKSGAKSQTLQQYTLQHAPTNDTAND